MTARSEGGRPPRIVLVRPKLPENVGAAARAMKNFGAAELWLVAPRCRIDRRAHALASHAGDVLDAAREVPTLSEALHGIAFALGTSGRPRSDEPSPTLIPELGVDALRGRQGAIVFGPEDHGLSNRDLDLCQAVVTIPTAEYASVNLAQAVNILCYVWHAGADTRAQPAPAEGTAPLRAASGGSEDASAPAASGPAGGSGKQASASREVASRDQYERMYGQLRSAMLLIGYTDQARADSIMRMYRGFLDRAQLDPRELAALRGLWSQVEWAAERAPEELPGRRGKR